MATMVGFLFWTKIAQNAAPAIFFFFKNSPGGGNFHLAAIFILKKINFIKNSSKSLRINGLRSSILYFFKKCAGAAKTAVFGLNH
jgi:hypothetical protein